MLTRVANPSRNGVNSLAAGIKHSPDDLIVHLMGKILNHNEGLRDGVDQPRNKSKGKRKGTNRPMSSSKKAMKLPWTPETAGLLLKYIKEYKTKCKFWRVNFESMALGFRGFVGRHSPRDNVLQG